MRDMRVGEKISPTADAGHRADRGRAMDRHEFAEGIFVADFEPGRFAGIFQILRDLADRAESKKAIAAAEAGCAAQADVMLQPAVVAENHARPNDAVGPN